MSVVPVRVEQEKPQANKVMQHTQHHDRRNDQAARLRELVRRGRSATTIAVISGKGGVGKSNIAVNLSMCLSSRGLRVTLVDADMGLANADLLMNLHPRYTLAHVVGGVRDIEEVVMEGPGGVRFVPGASGVREMADLSTFEREHLVTQLGKLETNTDMMVLDCGAGISKSVMSFASCADRVVVVTTTQPTALTDAYAMIKSFDRTCALPQLGLFVNMAAGKAAAQSAFTRVEGVVRRFLNYTIANDGYMLQDISVELAVQQRCPFVIRYPRSNASACVAAMAKRMARSFEGSQRRGGFFSRVAGLFM